MKEALDALLESLGQAPTRDVEPFMTSRRFQNLRATLANGSQLLVRISRMPAAHRGLLHEAAAFSKLAGTDIPKVGSYELVGAQVFGSFASISSWIPGSSGIGVMDAQPLALPVLCQAIGGLRGALEAQTSGGHGLSVVDGRFVAIRPFWDEEYLARAYDWFLRAEAVGASLGPLSIGLLERVRAGAPAMRQVRKFCLVHGDLKPSNLVLDVGPPPEKDAPPTLQLAGVVDWEFSGMADPLLAFALPFELPPDALAHVLSGYGHEKARAWMNDPEALARLDAYSAGRVLQYLALVVAAQIEGGGAAWGRGMAYAAELAAERIEPGFSARRLEAIFAQDPPETIALPEPPDPAFSVIRRALGRSSCRPVLGASSFGGWFGALCAALRSLKAPEEGWARDGMVFLDSLGPEVSVRGFEPIPDRLEWARSLDHRVRQVSGVDAFSLAATWVAFLALESLNWSVPDRVLRGIESQVFVLVQGAVKQQTPQGLVLHSVLALAAEAGLADLFRRPADSEKQALRLQALTDAWEDLTVFGGETPVDRAEMDWTGRGAPDPGAWIVPAVLLAIEKLPEVGIPKGKLVGAICG